MKKSILSTIIIAVIALSATICHAQGSMMERDLPEVEITGQYDNTSPTLAEWLGQIKGITSVYVSKSIMAMAGSISEIIPGTNMKDKLDTIHIFNAETPEKGKELRQKAEKFMKEQHYEIMMEINEHDHYMCIRMKEFRKDNREFVLLTDEGNEVAVIILCGNITEDDLKHMKM